MRVAIWRVAWLGLCLFLVRPAAAAPIPADKLSAWLDTRVGGRLQAAHVAGAAVVVVQGGRIVALRGYGLAGVAPNRPVDPARTLFGLASTSKLFTWLTLLRAVEAGRVDLNRPVNDYLQPDLRIPAQGFRRPIRFVDLLRHTTGYEDRDVMILSPAWFGGHQPSIADYLRHARPDREREPGVDPSYSNYAPNLAAFVALRGSGAPDFDTLVERDIFAPLGMTSTTFREPTLPGTHLAAPMSPALQARRTQNLLWDGNGFHAHKYEHMMDGPASAATTSAPDMARFMVALLHDGVLDGQRIYGPDVARMIRTPLLDGPQSNRWAHGFMMFALPGGHMGYGHDGGTTTTASTMVVVPELDLGVFAVTNSLAGGSVVYPLAADLVRQFYAPDWPRPGHPRPGSPALVRQADRYAGTYLTVRRPYHGLAMLVLAEPQQVSVDSQGYLHVASGGGERRWVPAGPRGAFIDADGAEVLAFRLDANGRAVSFRDPLATRTQERVSSLYAMPLLFGMVAASALVAIMVLIVALISFVRRRGQVTLPPVSKFARMQAITAATVLLALACVAGSAATADQAGGGLFPPLPLRLFALFACVTVVMLVVLAVQAPAMWRAAGRISRVLRLLVLLPWTLLMLRVGLFGGLAFWS